MIQFTVPGQPVAKGRPKFTMQGGFARAYTPKKTADYEALAKLADSDEKGEESELFKAYVERERGLAEQVKTNAIFTELGHDGETKTASAIDKINAEAKKLTEADPKITHEQAFAKVLDQQPKLYGEYLRERQ